MSKIISDHHQIEKEALLNHQNKITADVTIFEKAGFQTVQENSPCKMNYND